MWENKIQRYTQEWTDFLPSDPGITILETLQMFHEQQLKQAGKMTEEAEEGLLALLGERPLPLCPARVLVQYEKERREEHTFRPLEKFFAGESCFEAEEERTLYPGSLIAVYAERDGVTRELPLTGEEILLFGEYPRKGDHLYLLFSGPPAGEKDPACLLYVKVEPDGAQGKRNPRDREGGPVFAQTKWSALTENGYREIHCTDGTRGFTGDGEILLLLGEETLCEGKIGSGSGYLLRCTLAFADYDIPPRISSIAGPAVRLIQKDTKAALEILASGQRPKGSEQSGEEVSELLYYAREQGERGFTEYRSWEEARENGVEFRAVRRSGEALTYRKLGVLRTGKTLEVPLSAFPGLLADSIRLDAEVTGADGKKRHFFFRPGDDTAVGQTCSYVERLQKLSCACPPSFDGAALWLCGAAVTRGSRGNVRAGSSFLSRGTEPCLCTSLQEACGGRQRETMEEAICRFARQCRKQETAVTLEDYEYFAARTPGLCIHKVRADCRDRQVTVTVKPYGTEERPVLTDLYKRQIYTWLEGKRLLGMRVHVQGVHYIPLRVYADLVVFPGCPDCRGEAEELLREALEDVHNDRRIGTAISFTGLYSRLEALEGVNQVRELAVIPKEGETPVRPGEEIPVRMDGLCYIERLQVKVTEGGRYE